MSTDLTWQKQILKYVHPIIYAAVGLMIFHIPFVIITLDVFYPFYFDKIDLVLYSYVLAYCAGIILISDLVHEPIYKGRTLAKDRFGLFTLYYFLNIASLMLTWLTMTISSYFFENYPEFLFWITYTAITLIIKHFGKEYVKVQIAQKELEK